MGPTASGKSALALALASAFRGEIVSADSMQIYRGLNIGTAKPLPSEQAAVPHHLVDIADITEKYDVFRFLKEAESCVSDIRARKKLPVIAGGTGLYLRALMYGLDPLPADPVLRGELDRKYDNDEHYPELCSLMEQDNPEDFAKFSSNRRKLLRAREVFLLSGQPMCRLQERWKELPERIVTATWQFARRQNTWFRTQHPEAVRLAMPQTTDSLIQAVRRHCGF